MANGIADDLLSATVLATRAPSCDRPGDELLNMYANKITQSNIERLEKAGYRFVGPEYGKAACGTEGVGRLARIPVITKLGEPAAEETGKYKRQLHEKESASDGKIISARCAHARARCHWGRHRRKLPALSSASLHRGTKTGLFAGRDRRNDRAGENGQGKADTGYPQNCSASDPSRSTFGRNVITHSRCRKLIK